MLRAFRSTRNTFIRGTVAGFALAIALAGGVSVGSAAVTPGAALAQEGQQNSEGFAEAYQPVANMVQPETANFEGAKAAIPTIVAAIETPKDRQVAGNLILNIGTNLSDPALQRQGLEMMLESGLTPAEQVGQFNYYVGSMAYNAQDYAAARAAMRAAMDAGYTDNDNDDRNDPAYLILQSHLAEGDVAGGLTYLNEVADAREAAGQTIPEQWLLLGLQKSYDEEMADEALGVSEMLLAAYPSATNWKNSLQVVNALNEFEPEARVDLYRLMRATDSLSQRQEFIRYIEDLDPRVMSNEVQDVLAAGLTAGVFESDDPYYTEVKGIADTRAPQDRSGIEGIVRDGESGDSIDAMGAGDVLYSLGEFARAEGLYRMALEKGADANTAQTRIGITQVEQGNYTAALETFGTIDGPRTPIARLWAAYAAYMM